MKRKLDPTRIGMVRDQVRSALAEATGAKSRDALRASLELLDALAGPPRVDRSSKYAGSIDYTFEDEQFEPFGREVDVRVHYDWYDYDSADEPSPVWGAAIADLEVRAVRHFDEDGNEVDADQHDLDVAWSLLNLQYEQVTDACTEDGYHRGVGKAPSTYAPPRSSTTAGAVATSFSDRMAPSIATRAGKQDRRQLG